MPIDLIPFGGISTADQMIEWPPARDVVLTVAGFEEAWTSSMSLEVENNFVVRVASAPGLTLLKLIAWADRHIENNKDATDLHRLLTTYADAGNIDRLYDQELALLESAEFNLEFAGATLLGRDVASICSSSTKARVQALLTSPRLIDRMIGQMVTSTDKKTEPTAVRLVSAFCRGFLES